MARTAERNQFLTDILTTAIENHGYGWFLVDEYRWEGRETNGTAYAVITEDATEEVFRIDVDVIARGLGKIRERWQSDPIKAYAGLRLADRTNGDDGDYDVFDALAVVEYALFGKLTYA